MFRVFLIPSLFLLCIATAAYYSRIDAAHHGDTIVFANAAKINTRDTTRMSWSQDIRLAMGLFEGLVIYNRNADGFLPGVAETWKHSDDGLTWTFNLRKDARWSNGDP